LTPRFEITFTEDCWVDEGTPFRGLRLTFQDESEGDCADLTSWSAKDYEAQWLAELIRIVTSQDKGALIISMHDPAHAFQIMTWTMWKKNGQILFQNRLLFMLEANQSFDPFRVSDYIEEYESHTEDGDRISEWSVPIAAIRNFISETPFASGDPCFTPS
jgi:hypothetical protein